MNSSLRSLLAVLCAVGVVCAAVGCDSGGGNQRRSVMGSWEGTIETDSVTYELAFGLQRPAEAGSSSGRLVGDGELIGNEAWAFQIPNGSFVDATLRLTLTLRFEDSEWPILLEGTVAEDYETVSAELSGGPPRFDGKDVTLTRP